MYVDCANKVNMQWAFLKNNELMTSSIPDTCSELVLRNSFGIGLGWIALLHNSRCCIHVSILSLSCFTHSSLLFTSSSSHTPFSVRWDYVGAQAKDPAVSPNCLLMHLTPKQLQSAHIREIWLIDSCTFQRQELHWRGQTTQQNFKI